MIKTKKMKKTELKDVYCVPKTDEELMKLGFNKYARGFPVYFNGVMQTLTDEEGLEGLTEIPVSKFIDLLEDRIVAWRLEEIGFKPMMAGLIGKPYSLNVVLHNVFVATTDGTVSLDTKPINIKTFTELETLISFLK